MTYLYEQGAHLLLVHNSPDPDRHKRPLWRAWQLPQNRPTLQQCLEHLASGGLLGLLPASIGLLVVDIDEAAKDGLANWIDRYPPLGDIPSQQPGRTHLYYSSGIPYHNRNKLQLRRYGISLEVRSRHGFVILWDPEAVAEIVAERSMSNSTRGITRLPRTVLGLKVSRHPWEPVAAIQGLQELSPQRPPARRSRPRPSGSLGEVLPMAPASWTLPDPPEHLLQVQEGRRNNEIFDAVRHPVYQLPRGQGGEAMRIRWYALVEEYTEWCNRLLPVPMRPARVQSTARSIARWTWVNPNFGRGAVMGWKDPVRVVPGIYHQPIAPPGRFLAYRDPLPPEEIAHLGSETFKFLLDPHAIGYERFPFLNFWALASPSAISCNANMLGRSCLSASISCRILQRAN